MNAHVDRLRQWWHGREPRERAMLAAMAAMLAGFAWWYGLWGPLRALRDAAAARHDQAVLAVQALEAGIAALPAPATGTGPLPEGAALERMLLDSARSAGLTPSRQREADGGVVIAFDRVPSTALFGWLGALVDAHGLAPSALQVERADGQLRAEVAFATGAAP